MLKSLRLPEQLFQLASRAVSIEYCPTCGVPTAGAAAAAPVGTGG